MTQTRARQCFDEGEEAFGQDDELDDCPYPMESTEGANWIAGFEAAAYENSTISNDDAYNDPRRGQAADLNRGR